MRQIFISLNIVGTGPLVITVVSHSQFDMRGLSFVGCHETITNNPDSIFWPASAVSLHAGTAGMKTYGCLRALDVDDELEIKECFSRRQVDQSSLGLPSRDYYLNKTANEKVLLTASHGFPVVDCSTQNGQQ